jgi:ABC-type nickel/cobalt efflux system permease component RcnA
MRHFRVIATSLVIAIAGLMFISPASSQISIRMNPAHRDRHHVVYHHRHAEYRHRHVVYHHRHIVDHDRRDGVRVRLNVR